MALKGLDIFKLTPKTNCKECGNPTCMAFAEDIVKNQAAPDECTVILKRILREKGLHHEVLGSEFEGILTNKPNGEENPNDGE